MNLQDTINKNNLPKHLAIIMDGNGRWAKQQGFAALGHESGTKSVKVIIEASAKLGIEFLTLYALWKLEQTN
jgi:undecaprenyl diphosphate synthase